MILLSTHAGAATETLVQGIETLLPAVPGQINLVAGQDSLIGTGSCFRVTTE